MKTDKRFWSHVAAGTVAVIAIVFGVKQCSDKQDARQVAQQWRAEVNKKNEIMTEASSVLASAREEIDILENENDALRDTIAVRDSTIAVLRDSLDICQGKKKECIPCKKKATPAKKKPVAKKTVSAKPVAAKPAVFVTKDTVIVSADAPKPSQGVIVNGDNNGQIIINANGIVNANGNVNGHDNQVNKAKDKVEAARRAYLESCGQAVVLDTRVKCR